jgi:hypothetical protein
LRQKPDRFSEPADIPCQFFEDPVGQGYLIYLGFIQGRQTREEIPSVTKGCGEAHKMGRDPEARFQRRNNKATCAPWMPE